MILFLKYLEKNVATGHPVYNSRDLCAVVCIFILTSVLMKSRTVTINKYIHVCVRRCKRVDKSIRSSEEVITAKISKNF